MADGRGADGRFLVGNPGGPGRGGRAQELAHAFRAAVEPADVAAVGAKLHALALEGDVEAARLWLSYAAGKPAETLRLGVEDGREEFLAKMMRAFVFGEESQAEINAIEARVLAAEEGAQPLLPASTGDAVAAAEAALGVR